MELVRDVPAEKITGMDGTGVEELRMEELNEERLLGFFRDMGFAAMSRKVEQRFKAGAGGAGGEWGRGGGEVEFGDGGGSRTRVEIKDAVAGGGGRPKAGGAIFEQVGVRESDGERDLGGFSDVPF